jgi:phosphatidylinositol-3-phosphatase
MSGRGRRQLGALIAVLGLLLPACDKPGGATAAHTVVPSTVESARIIPPATASRPEAVQNPSSSTPCGTTTAATGYDHVVWIVMENRSSKDVIGSPSAPYLRSLAAACGLATNYRSVSHPSLPNYLALTSGSTYGIHDDNGPGSHPLPDPSIFSLLFNDWRSLEESMPVACDRASTGQYAVKHNPAPYYTNLDSSCTTQDLPLNSTPDVTARFTLIAPNLCDDMHDCSTAVGDLWLAAEVPRILDSLTYHGGHTVVFITWDEDDAGNGTVPAYVIAPSVQAGTQSALPFTHYSLLRTTEELLGLEPLLGAAATANSMASAFNL